ncbi:MAG: hypothetical protein JW940_18580 [Polyangiaceae bacterium]|nr:hypothetical protein [Polyangiaceae bacterium]
MWRDDWGAFLSGTLPDGVTPYTKVIPLETQTWALLALPEWCGGKYRRAVAYAEKHHAMQGGFDFDTDHDGVWYEGTGQMGVLYNALGSLDRWERIRSTLRGAQDDGRLPAANKDDVTTGFDLPMDPVRPWLHQRRAHIGATAWAVFAECQVNPLWMGFRPVGAVEVGPSVPDARQSD